MRAVLDPNVLISAALSPQGAPAQVVARWLAGDFELIVSEVLLDELARALAYPRLAARIAPADAAQFVSLLREGARVASAPADVPSRSADPGDDYLLALAESERAILVSGDRHLLALAGELPIRTARQFLAWLTSRG